MDLGRRGTIECRGREGIVVELRRRPGSKDGHQGECQRRHSPFSMGLQSGGVCITCGLAGEKIQSCGHTDGGNPSWGRI